MDPIDAARREIDSRNEGDPTRPGGEPLARDQGRRAESWVVRLDPDASTSVRLAARGHHLRRWVVPRSSYPDGRAGHLRWRRDQKARHAEELAAVLDEAGVDEAVGRRAAAIVAKKGLGSDPEVQLFEDAVSLTFVETQLRATIEKVGDDDKMVEVLAKAWAKMSDAGRAAAGAIELDDHSAAVRARAVAQHAESATGSDSRAC